MNRLRLCPYHNIVNRKREGRKKLEFRMRNYAAGSACLAWPFWAAAPLVQARPAPPFLSAMPVILPFIAPLLLLLETNTEAKAVVGVARGVEVALS